jgi:hypothetical protein
MRFMDGPFARNAFYNTRMFTVTQELRFCYGHRLLEHPGKCGRLHGHNAVPASRCGPRPWMRAAW